MNSEHEHQFRLLFNSFDVTDMAFNESRKSLENGNASNSIIVNKIFQYFKTRD